MNWRELWARFSTRERGLIFGAGSILVLLLLRITIISPFLAYRENLREEIVAHRDQLESASVYLARASDLARQRQVLAERYRQLQAQLVPGDTPTLAAATLQNTLHGLASEHAVDIQSTQVMRDEKVGDFHRIAVRLTVAGELKALAGFLAGIEYGPQRVSIPFLEISKRGAVLRGRSGRALSATIEVTGFLQGAEPTSGVDGGSPAATPAPTATPAGDAAPLPGAGDAT